jgi:hypothetical protein
MDDAVTNITIDMTANPDINYDASRTVYLIKVGNGYNYTGYSKTTGTTLSAINTSLTLGAGYFCGLWDRATFTWDYWISGFAGNVDQSVARWNVIVTKIESNKTWVL